MHIVINVVNYVLLRLSFSIGNTNKNNPLFHAQEHTSYLISSHDNIDFKLVGYAIQTWKQSLTKFGSAFFIINSLTKTTTITLSDFYTINSLFYGFNGVFCQLLQHKHPLFGECRYWHNNIMNIWLWYEVCVTDFEIWTLLWFLNWSWTK